MQATTVYGARVYAVRGSYDDCSRLISEFAGEVDDWGIVNVNLRSYYAEGSKTLAFEIVEQLGWDVPTAVVAPIASGAMFSKLWQGFEQFGRLGLIDERRPRLYGGQAEGCSPVATAFWEERRVSPVRPNSIAKSLAIGNPADGDLAIATARTSGGAIYAVPEDEIGQNMAFLAETAGIFGETAVGVTVGALRAAAARGDIGESRPRRRARHRHRPEDAAGGRGRGRRLARRDRRRPGRAARGARGHRVSDVALVRGPDRDRRRRPRAARRGQPPARARARPARAQGRERAAAARPRPRGRDDRGAPGGERRARSRTTASTAVPLRARPDPQGDPRRT